MSHIARLYVDQRLASEDQVILAEAQSKYLLRVMRLEDGAIIRVFNGRDGEWRCALGIHGKKAILEPFEQTRTQSTALDLTLMFAPIKKTRTDFIVEKASELGVRTLQPVITEYTQTNRVRTDRLQALVIEAAEQTERMDIPEVRDAAKLSDCLAAWDRSKPLFYCDEGSTARPMVQALKDVKQKAVGLLVGPEGGFSPRERDMLRALDFVISVTLGPRILRAETAIVSALTLWQAMVGDWNEGPYLA
ncbi:MAG: 16S rRNA (uracil(1498)-N(3))-methyltransferase [Pseudomonadota bacterium]